MKKITFAILITSLLVSLIMLLSQTVFAGEVSVEPSTTQASAFRPYAIPVIEPYNREMITDLNLRLLDADDNNLIEYLVIAGEVSSLKTGNYIIYGDLFDVNGNYITRGDLWDPSNGPVSFISSSKSFDEENKSFEMFFRGHEIFKSGSSGPYRIEITIMDADYMVCAEGNTVTEELTFENFHGDLLQIESVTDELIHLIDGRAKTLRFIVDINARAAGTYYISGNLIKDDNSIQLIEKEIYLHKGSNIIKFDFDTLNLSRKELAGPYSLFIYDDHSSFDETLSKNYTLDQLALPPIYFIDGFQERIEKGMNDNLDLVIDIPVKSSVNGCNYRICASLWDSEDNPIDFICLREEIGSVGKVVTFNFDTSNIVNHGLDGPYLVQVSLFSNDEDGFFQKLVCSLKNMILFSSFPRYEYIVLYFAHQLLEEPEDDDALSTRDYVTKAYTYKQFVDYYGSLNINKLGICNQQNKELLYLASSNEIRGYAEIDYIGLDKNVYINTILWDADNNIILSYTDDAVLGNRFNRVMSRPIILPENIERYKLTIAIYEDAELSVMVSDIETFTTELNIILMVHRFKNENNDVIESIIGNNSVFAEIIVSNNYKYDKDVYVEIVQFSESDNAVYKGKMVTLYPGENLIETDSLDTADATVNDIIAATVNDIIAAIVWDSNSKAQRLFEGEAIPKGSIANSGKVVLGTKIILSTTTEGARINYTIDGSIPTEESILFTDLIVINEPITVVKAVALKENMLDSENGEVFLKWWNLVVVEKITDGHFS